MPNEAWFQIVAFLLGGGAVSGGAAYWQKRAGADNSSTNGTGEAIKNLKRSIDRLEGSLGVRLDKIDEELRLAMNERHALKTQVALLEREHGE